MHIQYVRIPVAISTSKFHFIIVTFDDFVTTLVVIKMLIFNKFSIVIFYLELNPLIFKRVGPVSDINESVFLLPLL